MCTNEGGCLNLNDRRVCPNGRSYCQPGEYCGANYLCYRYNRY
jgi:hypothetical protein